MANVQELFNTFAPDTNENIQPFIDLIQEIMAMPEEGLNESNVNALKDLIVSSFPPEQNALTVNTLLKNLEEANLSPSQVSASVQQAENALKAIVEELQPSKFKRELIESVFNIFYNIFNEVVSRYHTIIISVKLDEGAQVPTYAHNTDACADIYASQNFTVPAHSLSNKIPTGLHIALPENWVLMIDPRSSIGLKSGLRLSNSIGIIDEEYRGEICILYDNFSDSDYEIKAGDRIAQCWVQPVYRSKWTSVDILPESNRGEGGFGSTGK